MCASSPNLLPRIHKPIELIKENDIFLQIQVATFRWLSLQIEHKIFDILMSLVVDITRGLNDVSNNAVIFFIWLCLSDLKPPFLYEKACWRSNFVPHSECEDGLNNDQLYCIRIKSQNKFLVRLWLSYFIDKVGTQLDAHCSWFSLLICCWLGEVRSRLDRIISKSFWWYCCYVSLILLFTLLALSFSCCYLSCFIISSAKLCDSICENSYYLSAIYEKMEIARPPNFVGRDISFLSLFGYFSSFEPITRGKSELVTSISEFVTRN